jgi:tetratricopeptide (TPR) repeat protein
MYTTINLLKNSFFFCCFSLLLFRCETPVVKSSTSTNTIQEPPAIPALLPRKGELAKAIEWQRTRQKVAELTLRVASHPSEVKPRLQLATIYIAEARITGEHPYYYPAIHQLLDGVLMIDPKNFEATVFKASVDLSQHQFAAAKEMGEKAKAINPSNAYVYGILVDANVELGQYQEAIAASDKMQTLKPSLEAYSRASYLREIFGDYQGAIDAMKLAVEAGLPGSEPQCWSRNILGELYLKTGDLAKAEEQFNANLALRPSYAFAMAGLAKIEHRRKRDAHALQLLDSAAAILPEFSFHELMGDIYAERGDTQKAAAKYAEVKTMLAQDAASGHRVSLEMAKLSVKMNQLDTAETYAMDEYKIRPANIEVNKELAWILFLKHDMARAKEALQVARSTNSKDPELLSRAAAIEKRRG